MRLSCPRGRSEYRFTILNEDEPSPLRSISSLLAPNELEAVDRQGFVFLSGLLDHRQVEQFRSCIEEVRALRYGADQRDTYPDGRFEGQYLRDLHAWSRSAWPLLMHTPIVDTVRSLLGPRILLRSYSARVTFPGSQASTIWHADQRSGITPAAPWFTPAHSVTVIVYLDRADAASGQTSLVPGSHKGRQFSANEDPFDEAITLSASPGDALFFHGALLHRGGPNTDRGAVRRVLNMQFVPSWCRQSSFEPIADTTLLDQLVAAAKAVEKRDDLELLGLGGYM